MRKQFFLFFAFIAVFNSTFAMEDPHKKPDARMQFFEDFDQFYSKNSYLDKQTIITGFTQRLFTLLTDFFFNPHQQALEYIQDISHILLTKNNSHHLSRDNFDHTIEHYIALFNDPHFVAIIAEYLQRSFQDFQSFTVKDLVEFIIIQKNKFLKQPAIESKKRNRENPERTTQPTKNPKQIKHKISFLLNKEQPIDFARTLMHTILNALSSDQDYQQLSHSYKTIVDKVYKKIHYNLNRIFFKKNFIQHLKEILLRESFLTQLTALVTLELHSMNEIQVDAIASYISEKINEKINNYYSLIQLESSIQILDEEEEEEEEIIEAKNQPNNQEINISLDSTTTHSCALCSYEHPNYFTSLQGLYNHYRIVHQKHYCKTCHSFLNSSKELNNHKIIYHIKCKKCKSYFKDENAITQHQQKAHPKRKNVQYKCENCDQSFKTKKMLIDHQITHQELCCNVCQTTFATNKELIGHLNLHHIQCPQCKVYFENEQIFGEHKSKDHNKIIKFTCNLCNKTLDASISLKNHVLMQHEKKSICRNCSAVFDTKNELSDHQNLKHVKCPLCNLYLKNQQNLVVHIRIKHPIKKV